MTMYEYKCPSCNTAYTSPTRDNRLDTACTACNNPGPLHRVFGFALKPMMHEHLNSTVGKPISDMNQFKSELSRASDEASRTTGIEHNYKPLEYGDHAAAGATGEGIYESNVVRSRLGEPLLPLIE